MNTELQSSEKSTYILEHVTLIKPKSSKQPEHDSVAVQSVSHVLLFVTPWTVAHQAFLPFTVSQSLFKLISIQPPHSLMSPSLLAPNLSQNEDLFQWVVSSYQVAKVLEFQHQSFHWIFRVDFLQDWWVWSPWCSKDSQEPSPAPHFKSINSSVLSLLYGPTLTSIHDYWKNYSFDYMDLCQQSDVSI